MPWDPRRGGRRYYYRSERDVNGQPRRLYLGSGEAAERAAAEDRRRREERQAADAAWQAELAALLEFDALVERFCRLTDLLLAAAMLDAGYEKMRRGHWRRKHGSASRSGERPENGPEN
jgi:hypothetical protein